MPATGAMVELLLAAGWTDVTSRTYLRDRIRITRGRQDQGARVDPGSCTLTLNNKGGYFSPRNPMSPLYGQIGRNTPIRVSVPGSATYLDLDGSSTRIASTPSVTALNFTGDIDVRAEATANWWDPNALQTIAGRWGTTAASRLWLLWINLGHIQLSWTDGSGGVWHVSVPAPAEMPTRAAIRVTLDVNNGAGGSTGTLYWSDSISGTWTQIAAGSVAAAPSLATGSSPLAVASADATAGRAPIVGRVHAVEVRSGIGGTAVANPDFTAQTPGATSFADGAGRTWTVAAGALTNREPRFVGEISAWPARWDVSGGDVYVPVQAAGIMRRLGQGAAALDSTLRRRVTTWPTTVAYWPMEDGTGATQLYSPITGVQPATTAGAQLASDDSLPGSLALPVWPAGSWFTCTVPTYAASTSWQAHCVFKADTMPATLTNVLVVQATGTVRRWELAVSASAFRIRGYDSTGTLIVDSSFSTGDLSATWTRLRFSASTSGGTVTWSMQLLPVGSTAGSGSGTVSGTSGQVADVHNTFIVAFNNLRLGQVGVFSDANAAAYDSADTGFDGEAAAVRYARLASEEGAAYTTPYGIANTAAMGPQRGGGGFLDLLEQAQDADVGILYEARDRIALAYRSRASLYNQTPTLALDYEARGEVAPPLEPTEDDTATRNDITISRPAGSSARATLDTGPLSTLPPPSGVGRYATSQTINVQADGQLPDLAGWLLHLGTVDEPRYPAVTVNLAAGPWLAGQAIAVDLGDLITISNPPAWLPPGTISLMCQGYTETIGVYDWEITYNCTPGDPWQVAVLDDGVLGRADTDGSQLAAGITASATSLQVQVTAGPPWVTTALLPAEFPFDIRVGGEVMTVTAITGTSSPQTFTVTRSVNGIAKAQSAGADVRLATPMILAL